MGASLIILKSWTLNSPRPPCISYAENNSTSYFGANYMATIFILCVYCDIYGVWIHVHTSENYIFVPFLICSASIVIYITHMCAENRHFTWIIEWIIMVQVAVWYVVNGYSEASEELTRGLQVQWSLIFFLEIVKFLFYS